MKKLALVFAAALALTACTAAPTETTATPAATDPPAATEPPAEESTAEQFPIGELRLCDDWRRDTDTAYYTLYGHVDTTELTGLKLDYADGVQTKIMSLDIADTLYSDLLVTNDNVVRVFLANADGSEFRFKSFYPDGRSEERTASQEITPMVYDEYAAYVLRDNYVARLDWQTGEVTTWDASIPQIHTVLGGAGGKVLLTRIVSDMPLPTDAEMFEAVLQNSLMEYDLYDLASNTLEKLFADDFYPDGGWKTYLGYRGDMLYFVQGSPDGDGYKEALLGYDLTTGTMQELYAEASSDWVGGTGSPKSFSRGGQLELVFLQSTPDALHIYNAADGQVYNVPYHDPTLNAAYGTGENYGCPIAMTGDGRMLVTDGYTQYPDYDYPTDAYGLIDLDDYLAGSTDYTPIQMWAQ